MKNLLTAFLITFVLPAILYGTWEYCLQQSREELPMPAKAESTAPETLPQAKPAAITLPVIMSSGTVQMEEETYLVGVVLGEMPADFHEEALKAQAVVARTYTKKHHTQQQKHPSGALCTDPGCCQAYCSREDFLAAGHTALQLERVEQAVNATAGQVLTYDDELIDATYFSCSGGSTEAAVAVWGTDVPYLQAVESPGEEMALHYTDTVSFTSQEFLSLLNLQTQLPSESWIGPVTYTDGGGVAEIEILDRRFSGTDLRKLLGLRSTAFRITAIGNSVTVTTKGFGHRVGMSQYGAQAMALQGSGYDEILAHYYPSSVLENYREN